MDLHEDDNRWDYDCPQFVDFTVPIPFNDGADKLFESTVMGEGPSTSTAQLFAHDTQEAATDEDMVTSLELENCPKHASSGADEGPDSKKPRNTAPKGQQEKGSAKSTLTRSKSVRIPKADSASLHSDKSAATGTTSRPLRSHTRTWSQGRSRSNSVDLTSGADVKGDNSTSKFSKIPGLLKHLGETQSTTSSKLKSTEELEMEQIQRLKKELKQKRQMAQESFKKAMTKVAPVAVHGKNPTVPNEFSFQTDRRLKRQTEKGEEKSVGDFVKSLRSRTVVSPGPSTSGPKKLTVPQPFHWTEKHSGKARPLSAQSKFESMAEKVTAFHRKTPERFQARARSGEKLQRRDARSASPFQQLTHPCSPNLTARNRNRPNHFLSQEQLEAREVEEMKLKQFKARPANTKILDNPNTGVRKVSSKPATRFEEFSLSSGSQRKEEEEECFEFRAKPLNKKILEGPVGVKPAKPALPTVPMSPAFALKHRVRLPVEVPENKVGTSGPIRAKPVPHTGIPFQPKLPHQHTIPEPFSVEQRSKAMLAQKQEKIKHVLEEEKRAREFHAHPLPGLEADTLPEKHPKDPTKVEPFHLETDERGALYTQELAHKLMEKEEEQKKTVQFRAQPNRTIFKEPFIPSRSTKALTEVSEFELNSDRRAVQREEFELHKKEREVELEGHRRQREQRQKEEEAAAMAKLRAEMVHRPNPVRRYTPVVVKPSDKPLTEAESPRFSDRLRAKVRL